MTRQALNQRTALNVSYEAFLDLAKEFDYIARSFGYPDIPGWKVRQFSPR